MKILAVDTSSPVGSAALVADGRTVQSRTLEGMTDHVRALVPACRALMDGAGIGFSDLDVLVAGSGPGSFIGTRIGQVFAQALSFTCGAALVKISSLWGFDFSPAPERRVFVCRSRTDRYHGLICEDRGPKSEEDFFECPENELIARLRPGDRLLGPLSEKNRTALASLLPAGVEIGFQAPDAARIVINRLSFIEESARRVLE